MRRINMTYKSGNTVTIDFVGSINIKYKGDELTSINIKGRTTGADPVFWGLENVESVVVESVGWQRVAEYFVALFNRIFRRL